MLQFFPDLRNHANGPMKFCVTVFRTTAEDRYYETTKQIEGILARVDKRTIFPGTGFNKEAFDNFKGQPIMGSLYLEILYGHPEDGFSRKTVKIIDFELSKKKNADGEVKVSHYWYIRNDTDVPFSS
jgi:hypothetical protein